MKRILLLSFLFVTTLSAMADTLTIRQLFIEMPDTVIPYLSRNSRLDFLDFMDSKMTAEVTNELGGKSVLTALGDDSLTVRLNDACTVDLLLLKAVEMVEGSQDIICMVSTYRGAGEIQDCDVQYFTAKWRKLATVPQLTVQHEKRLSEHIKPSNILKIVVERLNKY